MKLPIWARALVLIGGISPAEAADLLLKAPPSSMPTNPWSGFYLGGHVGYGFGTQDIFSGFPTAGAAVNASTNLNGWIGGLQTGYNYQFKQLVLGVEGDFDWAGARRDFRCIASASQMCTATSEWFASLVGRVGVVFGPALFYLDGGAAWNFYKLDDVIAPSNALPSDFFSGSDIRPGWTLGIGVEYLLSHNWSLKAEYDFMEFGERSITLSDGSGVLSPQELKQTVQLAKVGFNYRFNGAEVDRPVTQVMSYAPEASREELEEAENETIQSFSSLDVGKYAVDGTVGGLFALTKDFEKSGPRLYLEGGAGWYKFFSTGGAVNGVYSSGNVLGGYGWQGEQYELNLLAGLRAENDMLSVIDRGDPVQGTAAGVMVRADTTVNPTKQTLFYAEGEYSTAFQYYYTSAKYGYDITAGKEIFAGPEVTALGDQRYKEWRVGGHISQIKFGKLEVDLSAGFEHNSSVGNGAYGEILVSRGF